MIYGRKYKAVQMIYNEICIIADTKLSPTAKPQYVIYHSVMIGPINTEYTESCNIASS